MKKTISLMLMSLLGLIGTYAFAGSDREDTVDRMQKSVEVLQSIMSTPDKGIPEEVLSGAKCIVVVPNLIKGGFILVVSTGVASPPAARVKAGVLRHSFPLVVEAGDCRSASKAWI
jgi:lipid-binding SYLF domain-containing protein